MVQGVQTRSGSWQLRVEGLMTGRSCTSILLNLAIRLSGLWDLLLALVSGSARSRTSARSWHMFQVRWKRIPRRNVSVKSVLRWCYSMNMDNEIHEVHLDILMITNSQVEMDNTPPECVNSLKLHIHTIRMVKSGVRFMHEV
ncbi:hypothetical protein LR48_Vigan06g123400 [Vigna angularis]|uniref:Uncharacterized protein n=1 Tax=Phaseolus angularis TaxID=3914 RepID=A0A0L9UT51_PHAAN|nr:hypothetical protein LR48_Vigan06g123400 [Vigna angularis]